MAEGFFLWYISDIAKLERIQRRWTREVEGLAEVPYRQRLIRLDLFSIYGRMLRTDLIKVWKSFHSEVDVGLVDILERFSHHPTRGHCYKLSIPICRSEIRRRFWNVRCVKTWNELPSEVVSSETLVTFKASLDSHLGIKLFSTVDSRWWSLGRFSVLFPVFIVSGRFVFLLGRYMALFVIYFHIH